MPGQAGRRSSEETGRASGQPSAIAAGDSEVLTEYPEELSKRQMLENVLYRPSTAHRFEAQVRDTETPGGLFYLCKRTFLHSKNFRQVSVRQCASSPLSDDGFSKRSAMDCGQRLIMGKRTIARDLMNQIPLQSPPNRPAARQGCMRNNSSNRDYFLTTSRFSSTEAIFIARLGSNDVFVKKVSVSPPSSFHEPRDSCGRSVGLGPCSIKLPSGLSSNDCRPRDGGK